MIKGPKFQYGVKKARDILHQWADDRFLASSKWKNIVKEVKHQIVPTFVPVYSFKFTGNVRYDGKLGTDRIVYDRVPYTTQNGKTEYRTQSKTVTDWSYVNNQYCDKEYVSQGGAIWCASLEFPMECVEAIAISVVSKYNRNEVQLEEFKNLKIPAYLSPKYLQMKTLDSKSIALLDWSRSDIDPNNIYAIAQPQISDKESFDNYVASTLFKSELEEFCSSDLTSKYPKYDQYKTNACKLYNINMVSSTIYVPMFVTYVNYNNSIYRIYISGVESDKIYGKYIMSLPKVFSASAGSITFLGELFNYFSEPIDYELFSWTLTTAGASWIFIPSLVLSSLLHYRSRDSLAEKNGTKEVVKLSDEVHDSLLLNSAEELEIRQRLYKTDIPEKQPHMPEPDFSSRSNTASNAERKLPEPISSEEPAPVKPVQPLSSLHERALATEKKLLELKSQLEIKSESSPSTVAEPDTVTSIQRSVDDIWKQSEHNTEKVTAIYLNQIIH
jgi:hypothetical protein